MKTPCICCLLSWRRAWRRLSGALLLHWCWPTSVPAASWTTRSMFRHCSRSASQCSQALVQSTPFKSCLAVHCGCWTCLSTLLLGLVCWPYVGTALLDTSVWPGSLCGGVLDDCSLWCMVLHVGSICQSTTSAVLLQPPACRQQCSPFLTCISDKTVHEYCLLLQHVWQCEQWQSKS